MSFLDPATLRSLLADANPALSLYLSLDPARDVAEVANGLLRDLFDEAEAALAASGLDEARCQCVLQEARAAAASLDPAEHRPPGLAIFVGDHLRETILLPGPPERRVVLARHYHIKPLLPLLARDRRFRLLTITGRETHLYEATPYEWREARLDWMLPEVAAELDGGAAVAADREERRQTLLTQDLRRIVTAVARYLGSDPAPLLLAAEPETGGHFHKIAQPHLPQLEAATLALNPAAFSEADLHARVVDLITPQLEADVDAAIEQVNARLGTARGDVSLRLEEILAAAEQGRAEAVIVDRDAALWGRYGTEGGLTPHGTPAPGDEDLLNCAAVLTMRNGGRAYAVPRARIPRGMPAAATFRY